MSKRKLESGSFNYDYAIYIKDEYTKKEAIKKAVEEEDLFEEDIEFLDAFVKYYPKASKDERNEYGENGVYRITFKKQRGATPVWLLEY